MPTLYVENVPADLYDALRRRAKERRSSIASQVIEVLAGQVPTAAQIKARQAAYRKLLRLQAATSPGPGPFPSTEEMVREDRER